MNTDSGTALNQIDIVPVRLCGHWCQFLSAVQKALDEIRDVVGKHVVEVNGERITVVIGEDVDGVKLSTAYGSYTFNVEDFRQ